MVICASSNYPIFCASCQPSRKANRPRAIPHVRFTQRKKVGVTNLRPQATRAAMKKHQSTAPPRKPAKKIMKCIGCGPSDMEVNTVVPSPVQKTMLSGFPRERKAPLAKSPRLEVEDVVSSSFP